MKRASFAFIALALLFVAASAEEKSWPEKNPDAKAPDKQAEKGPGSTEYAHSDVDVIERGDEGKHYWLYTPKGPALKQAPVVCFMHGWGGMKPTTKRGTRRSGLL